MLKLFHGEESYLSLKKAKAEVQKLEEENASYEVAVINCDLEEAEKIIQKVDTNDMFSSKKIFLIKRLYTNKRKEELVPRILEIAQKSDSPFIFWEDSKISKVTKYNKFFAALKSDFEFTKLKKPQFYKCLQEELADKKIKASTEAIKKLSELVNYDIQTAINEVDKILLGGQSEITMEYLNNNISNSLENTIWEFIDYLNQGIKPKAINILENILKQEVDPIFILAMITRNLRMITLSKSLVEQGKTNGEIASYLRIPPFTLPTIIRAANSFSHEDLASKYKELTELDYDIKTGGVEPVIGLSLLIAKIH